MSSVGKVSLLISEISAAADEKSWVGQVNVALGQLDRMTRRI